MTADIERLVKREAEKRGREIAKGILRHVLAEMEQADAQAKVFADLARRAPIVQRSH